MDDVGREQSWVTAPPPGARGGLRLYCLPYAGASASVYMRWKRRLPAWIEVVPVELPGRGRRIFSAGRENDGSPGRS